MAKKKGTSSLALAIALEGVGCSVGIAGITIECIMHADIGYILITGGALTIAAGSLLYAKLLKKGR